MFDCKKNNNHEPSNEIRLENIIFVSIDNFENMATLRMVGPSLGLTLVSLGANA